METTVYLDEYFLVNFSLDVFSLWFTARLSGGARKAGRFCAAALVGALYASLLIVFPLPLLLEYLTAAICTFFMAGIAFAPRSLFSLFRVSAWFSGVSLLLGGLFTILWRMIAGVFPRLALPRAAPLLFAAGGAAIALCFRFFPRDPQDGEREVMISWEDRTLTLRGLPDTGNLLREPVSGDPVLFLCERAAIKLMGAETAALLLGGEAAFSAARVKGLRIACFSTAAGPSSVLLAKPGTVAVRRGRSFEEKNYYLAILQRGAVLPDGIDCLLPAL